MDGTDRDLDRGAPGGQEDGAAAEPVDLRGLKCPLPALHTERLLREAPAGRTICVLADDPLARLDIAHACAGLGAELLGVDEIGGGALAFCIRSVG